LSAPNSPELHPLDYRVLGNGEVLQPRPKTVSVFTNALYLIWSALPDKAIKNAVKGYTASDCRHVCQPTVEILNI